MSINCYFWASGQNSDSVVGFGDRWAFTMWPWPLTLWRWTLTVYRLWHDQTLYQLSARSNISWLSYSSLQIKHLGGGHLPSPYPALVQPLLHSAWKFHGRRQSYKTWVPAPSPPTYQSVATRLTPWTVLFIWVACSHPLVSAAPTSNVASDLPHRPCRHCPGSRKTNV